MTGLIHHQRLFALNRNIVDGTFGRDIELCVAGLESYGLILLNIWLTCMYLPIFLAMVKHEPDFSLY